MPYVAMAEVKWWDTEAQKMRVVPAGDEVIPPVKHSLIRMGIVAFLDHVPGMTWEERVQADAKATGDESTGATAGTGNGSRVGLAPKSTTDEGGPKKPTLVELPAEVPASPPLEVPPGKVAHGGELVEAPMAPDGEGNKSKVAASPGAEGGAPATPEAPAATAKPRTTKKKTARRKPAARSE